MPDVQVGAQSHFLCSPGVHCMRVPTDLAYTPHVRTDRHICPTHRQREMDRPPSEKSEPTSDPSTHLSGSRAEAAWALGLIGQGRWNPNTG